MLTGQMKATLNIGVELPVEYITMLKPLWQVRWFFKWYSQLELN
jgi:hypothetical protein